MQFNLQDKNKYKVNLEDYELKELIYPGNYGNIYKIKKKVKIEGENEILACKIIKTEEYEDQSKIWREIEILQKNQYPTTIKFYGYSLFDFDKNPNITIIMDYANNGSLYTFLKREHLPIKYDDTAKQIILVGISHGMMHLHENNSIHRDLKPGNILLDRQLYPHICDFGLSKEFELGKSLEQSITDTTMLYMAPEMFRGNNYNRKVDVYAFAIIMFQVVTGIFPFLNAPSNFIQFGEYINKGFRPEFDPEKPIKKSFQNLIEKCWDTDPINRPTFSQIYRMLAFNFEEGESNENDNYFLGNVNVDKFVEYLKIIDDDFKNFMEGNNSSKYENYQKLMNNAKMSDEINSLKEKLTQSENEKNEMQNTINSLLKQISELTYKEKNNIDAIYSPLKGVTSVYPPKKH